MSRTKVSIVGLGAIAQIAHLPILVSIDDVEITAVCDVDKSKAKTIAQRYSIKNYYTDFDKMLDENESEVLIVTVPTNYHKELTLKALEHGLDVLVEKPLAREYDEAQLMVDSAKKNKRKLMVGMNNRFRPDFMMQKSFVSSGELGDIFYIKAGFLRRRSTAEKWSLKKEEAGGGVFMDLGIVLLDAALWLLKYPEVKSISAVNYNHESDSVEDSSFSLIRFENDATAMIECSWTLHREEDLFYCNVFGREGSSSVNPLKILKKMHGTLVNVTPLKMEKPANIFKKSIEYELKNFFNSIRNDTPIISTGEEALVRLRIIDALYKSAKLGKEITFK
jgi:predicted dehydrogenase